MLKWIRSALQMTAACQGQTIASYALVLAPAAVVVAFALAVLVLS